MADNVQEQTGSMVQAMQEIVEKQEDIVERLEKLEQDSRDRKKHSKEVVEGFLLALKDYGKQD